MNLFTQLKESKALILTLTAVLSTGFGLGYHIGHTDVVAQRALIDASQRSLSNVVNQQLSEISDLTAQVNADSGKIATLSNALENSVPISRLTEANQEITNLQRSLAYLNGQMETENAALSILPTPQELRVHFYDPINWCPWNQHGPCFVENSIAGTEGNYSLDLASTVWSPFKSETFDATQSTRTFSVGGHQYTMVVNYHGSILSLRIISGNNGV